LPSGAFWTIAPWRGSIDFAQFAGAQVRVKASRLCIALRTPPDLACVLVHPGGALKTAARTLDFGFDLGFAPDCGQWPG